MKDDVAISDAADVARRVKAILVGSLGNLVEYYDFYAYSAFSLYFAKAFFPGDDPVAQNLSTAAIFAIGFFMRPIGGWLFGVIADTRGRKTSLMLSVLLMCLGSLIVACAPTYATIGVGAPALLLAARLLQGLSLGGEYGSSATYLAEMATSERRGFYSSFLYVTLIGGQLTALVVLLALQNVFLTGEQLRAFGWRIPFVIGAALALFAFVMRRDLDETDAFKQANAAPRHVSGLRALLAYPRQALIVVGLTMGGHARLLRLHHLHAEVPEAVGGAHRRADDLGQRGHAGVRDDPATYLRRSGGPHRPPPPAARLRRARHARHRAAADHDPARRRPVGGFRADRCRVDDRLDLHLDQRGGEGGTVSRCGARHRRRSALRACGVDLRRLGRIYRAVVQGPGDRERLLLVRDGRDLLLAAGVFHHARHAGDVADRQGWVSQEGPPMEILLGIVIGVAVLFGVGWFAVRAGDKPIRRSPTGGDALDLTYVNADIHDHNPGPQDGGL